MRITTLIIGMQTCITSMLLAHGLKAQSISLDVKQAEIKQVFTTIEKQAGVAFIYNEQALQGLPNLTIKAANKSLDDVLKNISRQVPLQFKQSGKVIGVSRMAITAKPSIEKKQPPSTKILPFKVSGKITDKNGIPLPGATVRLNNTSVVTSSNQEGLYSITVPDEFATLRFSFIGMTTQEIRVGNNKTIDVVLLESSSELDQVKVIGYGTTTQRLSTGNASTVKSDVIANQPVTNPIQALIGRMPGVQIKQTTGLPGAGLIVEIRGRNSIGASNIPLYIVDGVPFSSTGLAYTFSFVNESPLNSINPSDIESVSVLKDADATAIYGSRGANGVILITTKKGLSGSVKFDVNVNNGYGTPTRLATPLSTSQYLQLRRDAFTNSNIVPTAANAPDLISWSPGVDNKLQDWYLGNTAKFWDANLSLSGGNGQTTFLISGAFHNESTVMSSSDQFRRNNIHLNFSHASLDKRFKLNVSSFFSADNNKLNNSATVNLLNIGNSVPNYPIYDANGNYNWTSSLNNYYALHNIYWNSKTDNLVSDIAAEYEILKGLSVKGNIGFNKAINSSMLPTPAIATNPANNTLGSNTFTGTDNQAFVFEPQIQFNRRIAKGKLEMLAGATVQSSTTNLNFTAVNNYINDLLLESQSGGTVASTGSSTTVYKFISFFSRVNYNLEDKYILNLTFRRDGSTRFGPNKQFGNFGSIGAAWLFSNEPIVKDNLRFLTYGKFRGSFGTTGSDGIGDYGYLNIYSATADYGSSKGISPSQIANPDFQWEVNKKLEFAVDLGFLHDRILLNTSWYRNRSGNQLVTYPLPSTTGFTGYIANLPAVVENSGWEFELITKNMISNDFNWSSSLNLTIPKNKLVSFPNIELTSYANTLVVGQSLNIVQKYHFLGIDPTTGIAQIQDFDGNNAPTARSSYNHQGGDYINAGTTDPQWYAGLNNSVKYRGFQLNVFLQYTRQMGRNIYDSIYSFGQFGRLLNFWTYYLDYWKMPGDQTTLPKPMTSGTTTANYGSSDATFRDASFLRIKNVAFSYELPQKLTHKAGLNKLKIYLQGQNVLTATKYLGYDPEYVSSASIAQIPPLKLWTVGLQATF